MSRTKNLLIFLTFPVWHWLRNSTIFHKLHEPCQEGTSIISDIWYLIFNLMPISASCIGLTLVCVCMCVCVRGLEGGGLPDVLRSVCVGGGGCWVGFVGVKVRSICDRVLTIAHSKTVQVITTTLLYVFPFCLYSTLSWLVNILHFIYTHK